MTALILRHPDGSTVQLGWSPDADRVYAQIMHEPHGLLALEGSSLTCAATMAAWVLRDVLSMPVLVASAVRCSPAETLAAARYLFGLALACQEHGLGKLEVVRDGS